MQVRKDLPQLIPRVFIYLRVDTADQLGKVTAVLLLDIALVDNRIEWISHLVGNCGVDQRRELILGLDVVVEDL